VNLLSKLSIAMLMCAALAPQCMSQTPAVAYTSDGALYVASESGQLIKKITAPSPIGDFAISPDLKTLIFASAVPGVVGGPFLIMDVPSGQIEPMMPDPYFNDASVAGDLAEFYTDPEFSADGKLVLFAAHAAGEGDDVHTSGPLAVLNLDTRDVSVVKSTVAADGLPYGHMRNPHWSPDGRRVLGNIEGRAFIADVDGQKLTEAIIPDSELTQSGNSYGMHAIGWLGPGCILYQAGESPQLDPARILELNTQKTSLAAPLLHLPEDSLPGLRDLSGRIRIVSASEGYRVESAGGNWLIRGDQQTTFARILDRPDNSESIPVECR
jgi:hypothetical protein